MKIKIAMLMGKKSKQRARKTQIIKNHQAVFSSLVVNKDFGCHHLSWWINQNKQTHARAL